MKKIVEYKNGNVAISIYEDGTKVMETPGEENFKFDFPTSIDVKITNKCEGLLPTMRPCRFCHENSSLKGKHGDLKELTSILDNIKGHGIELSIGGGNPLCHPDLYWFLNWCKDNNFLPSLTVNKTHLDKYNILIRRAIGEQLIYGLGISIPKDDLTFSENELTLIHYPHSVAHLILGIHKPDMIQTLSRFGLKKYLLLGFKKFGRGIPYYHSSYNGVDDNIRVWDQNISDIIHGENLITFDNLAIKQLGIKYKIPKKLWRACYAGDDFTHTMYIDAVKGNFAPTSRHCKRTSWEKINLIDYFNQNKNEFKQK
jgi:hypothetical protein